MLDEKTIRSAAASLSRAEAERSQIRQFHREYPGLDLDAAYAIQHEWVRMKLAAGRRLIGRKVGLTSRAMQTSVGINEPDYGALLDDMLFQDGAEIPADRFIEPRIEVELAFVLGRTLRGPGCTMWDAIEATDYIVPAIEIIDSRLQRTDPETGETRKIVDSIADNAANAGIVLGARPIGPKETDLRWISALLLRNGAIEETGVAAGVLSHPANGVAWLANKLSGFDIALEPGQIILSGSFTRAIFGFKGDTFHADYGPFGSVGFHFS